MALVTDLPGKLDFHWHPRNAHTKTLTWSDVLTGRTFEVRRPGVDAIDVTVVNATTMTFTVPAITRDSLKQPWSLVETTDVNDEVTWIGGTISWSVIYDDDDEDNDDVTVTVATG